MFRPVPDPVAEGQESVWDYPRPPALEPVEKRLQVFAFGVEVASTTAGHRVLETSHPPVYYFPPEDIRDGVLVPAGGGSFCEWKGSAKYFDLAAPADAPNDDPRLIPAVAWAYPNPTDRFAPIAGHVAFYCGKVDRCLVGGVEATPQPGGFYGGWVTPDIAGPIKGVPGSMGW